MKSAKSRTGTLALLAITLAAFLVSCANPVQYEASVAEPASRVKALVAPVQFDIPNYKGVLDLANGTTVSSYKIDRVPNLGEQVGPITITKLWYQTEGANLAETGTSVVGFDFTSTKPVYAVYVKGSSGGNLYDYRADGVTADTELHTIVNSSGKFAQISHVDFAWSTVDGEDDDDDDNEDPENPPPVTLYSVSGVVFHDTNVNGVLDSGETGLGGVTVGLSNGSQKTTAADGSYSFADLVAGTYTVTSNGKTGFFATPYASPVESRTTSVGPSVSGLNFGLSYETIEGAVFHDINANGVFDSGETGLGGVIVSLSNGSQKTTAADGSYSFTNLIGGTYTVTSNGKTGFFATPYANPVESRTVSVAPSVSGLNFGLSYETVEGVAFYDANRNDSFDEGEPLLEGITVRLSNGSVAVTDVNGAYRFSPLVGDATYTVTADDREGFLHSVASSRTVAPVNSVPAVANFGFVVDYSWFVGKTANGFTIGYWKTNLDKAIAGKTNGIQVSKTTLQGYVNTLSSFLLAPLNVATMQAASTILSATGSNPAVLLSKQLMGSEFNFASGAFIGGNALATRFFLYDGEYMLHNPGLFSSTQLLAQKDRYDAYNNSHGGAVIF
jgi:hypothetical protein